MRLSVLRVAVFAFCASMSSAWASSFSYIGTFTTDDQLQVFLFTAPSPTFEARTWSYAGGTNAASQIIAAGGFDPVLTLFDATGGLTASSPYIASVYNTGVGVATDPATGQAFDALMAINNLNPGHTYALVLSQFDNLAIGSTYGDGFGQTGNGNFTASEFGCGGSAFCDQTPAQRNGSWAVDITGVDSSTDTPEPASVLTLTAGIAGLVLLRRRSS
jgi:hypothetical protein